MGSMGSIGSIDLGLSMGSLSMFHLIHQIEGLRKAHHLPEWPNPIGPEYLSVTVEVLPVAPNEPPYPLLIKHDNGKIPFHILCIYIYIILYIYIYILYCTNYTIHVIDKWFFHTDKGFPIAMFDSPGIYLKPPAVGLCNCSHVANVLNLAASVSKKDTGQQ